MFQQIGLCFRAAKSSGLETNPVSKPKTKPNPKTTPKTTPKTNPKPNPKTNPKTNPLPLYIAYIEDSPPESASQKDAGMEEVASLLGELRNRRRPGSLNFDRAHRT